MKRRTMIALSVLGVGATIGIIAAVSATGGGGRGGILNLAAPTFVSVEESTHNNNANSVCGSFVMAHQGADRMGDLNAKTGSFVQNVSLPQRSRVTGLTIFANDFSAEDAHVYLIRKRLKNGLSPQFQGYQVMAKTKTNGAVMNTMRRFSDTTIRGAQIDNAHFEYMVEMVVCDAIEPFAVQVDHSR